MGLLKLFSSKSPALKRLEGLDESLLYIANHASTWLRDISREDMRANTSATPVTLETTLQDWDWLAEQYPDHAPYKKQANAIKVNDNVIEYYPFVGELESWKNAVRLYEQIGVNLSLTFDSITKTETVIDIHTSSKDGTPLYKKLDVLRAKINLMHRDP